MVDKIKRADVAQMVRTWKGGEFDALDGGGNRTSVKKIYVENTGGSAIEVGDPIQITGITGNDLSDDDFLKYYLTNGFLFKGSKFTSSYDLNNVIAIAEEPAKANGVCEALIQGLYFGRYNHSGTETLSRVSFNTSGKYEYDPLGNYIVIAKSNKDNENNGYVILLYDPLIGPFVGMYRTGTHNSCTESTNHVHLDGSPDVVIKSVTVPLGSLESGTNVLIMKNRKTGGWMVTEAACPSE